MTTNGTPLPLAAALAERGYDDLTPVQEAVLQPDLRDADLLVSAQTGSGKTVAFGMAMAPTLLGDAERFGPADAPLALAVAPTRELALQVRRELEWLYAKTGAVIASCVGGMDPRAERQVLKHGAHIVVGTPGRLRDHITRRAFDTDDLRVAILDEADEMLDLGFREDLEFILDATPETRRTLMFSATVPAAIAKLAKSYQRDAVRVTTKEEREQHADIEYQALLVAPREHENAIINVLRYHEAANALVFCNTRAAVNRMVARFNNRGFSVVALSGELTQGERTNALQALRDGRAQVCIATDVAARGIDLPKLELVVHADLPSNPETLLHRSGRTGRAGRKGISALIVEPKSRGKAERLLRLAKVDAEWANPPSADDVNARDEERMLTDATLVDDATAAEAAAAARLLERFSAEQIAAAYLRLAKAGRSAPEDIQAVSVEAPKPGKFDRTEKPAHREFAESLWLSLSVGRKHNAEPRWLIPLLCKAGDITKRSIGTIKMMPEETYVQLDAGDADAFLERVGPKLTLEKNVRVKVLDAKPDFDASVPFTKPAGKGGKPSGKGAGKGYQGKKPWTKGKPAPDGQKKPGWAKTSGGGKKANGPKPGKPFAKKGKRKDAGAG